MKTSELTGVALDWALAKCEGFDVEYEKDRNDFWFIRTNHAQQFLPPFGYLSEVFHPSENWSQGGEIIERESISLAYRPKDARGLWCAVLGPNRFLSPDFEGYGPTPLIAAMRCYVASKLGDDVTLPPELEQTA
jgi:hypothetical protein